MDEMIEAGAQQSFVLRTLSVVTQAITPGLLCNRCVVVMMGY